MHAPSATCFQHELREAVGICVRCHKPSCGECITKIDGVNHCRACLEQLVRQSLPAAPQRASELSALFAILVGISTLSALAFLTLQVLMPGSAP